MIRGIWATRREPRVFRDQGKIDHLNRVPLAAKPDRRMLLLNTNMYQNMTQTTAAKWIRTALSFAANDAFAVVSFQRLRIHLVSLYRNRISLSAMPT
jgi:hypothetical protein